MSNETPSIPKAYEPSAVESKWYAHWLANNCFEESGAIPGDIGYTIAMPPPNVTGVLTMGHVLNNTLQDILARRARQNGKKVLWLPGTDHAGIATQTKVEQLLASEGTSRQAIGREAFLEKACSWRDKHGGIIIEQLKKLGVSCAWKRQVHTLDADYSNGVLHAFVELYKRGYIYRGKRMVNWCPVSLTALSDEEVIMRTSQSTLYTVRYPLANSDDSITISTTRPETIMADVAIAVNPEDARYKHLIGKHALRPLQQAPIPIIADSAVDPTFGTGALKVTPAHDAVDFAIGKRHHLPFIDLFNPNGTLSALAGSDFEGLDRFEARKKAAQILQEMGLLVSEKPYENTVGYSERGNVPVEPRVSEQWFLKYPKVDEAKKAIQDGHIHFWPERWTKVYLHWLSNIQDWCISRQLWWGHRIPVWYKKGADRTDPSNWFVDTNPPQDIDNWEQDADVLDTWFSSWLWPIGILGFPDADQMQSRKFAQYYPTHDLVTGPDIIFFWVSRMIMASLEFLGPQSAALSPQAIRERIPFKNVYFTGIIRDSQGRKMSKSLGNSPDPLDLIAQYGADGLRFGITSMAPQGQDILFNSDRIAQGRNFCNKLWNACRFRQMSGPITGFGSLESIYKRIQPSLMQDDDHALLSELMSTLSSVQTAYEAYEFNTITQHLYRLFWSDFCDWYLEVSKSRMQDPAAKDHILAIQDLTLYLLLQLLHPFMPFITEELAHQLGFIQEGEHLQNKTLITSDVLAHDLHHRGIQLSPDSVHTIHALRTTVTELRALKSQFNVASKKDVICLTMVTHSERTLLEPHIGTLQKLCGFQEIRYLETTTDAPSCVTPLGTFALDLSTALDSGKERERIQKSITELEALIASNQAKLNNTSFTSKAPAHVLAGAQKLLEDNLAKKAELERIYQSLT